MLPQTMRPEFLRDFQRITMGALLKITEKLLGSVWSADFLSTKDPLRTQRKRPVMKGYGLGKEGINAKRGPGNWAVDGGLEGEPGRVIREDKAHGRGAGKERQSGSNGGG